MIDDIAEETTKGIFRTIARFLFSVIVEAILLYTGEIVLFLITAGHKKPRWDYYALEKPSKFVILTDVSVLIGFATWLSIAWFINSKIL